MSYISFSTDDVLQGAKDSQDRSEKERVAGETNYLPKFKEGETVLRIVPPPAEWLEWFQAQGVRPTPFFPTWKHFFQSSGDGWVNLRCPSKIAGGVCPVCSESKRLYNAGDDNLGKKLRAKRIAYVNVIDRDNEELGPQVWEMSYPSGEWKGYTMYERVAGLMQGRAARNLIDPVAGFDLIVTRKGTGFKDTRYTVQADLEARPLGNDTQIQLFVEQQADLRTFVGASDEKWVNEQLKDEPWYTYREMDDEDEGYGYGDDPADNAAAELVVGDAENNGDDFNF